MRSRNPAAHIALLALLALLAGSPALAGDLTAQDLGFDPNLYPELLADLPSMELPEGTPAHAPSGDHPAAWGTNQGTTWIPASAFTVRLSSTSPAALSYVSFHFYTNTGGGATQRYFAALDLEPGLRVSHISCVYNDAHATDNIGFQWQRYSVNTNTGTTTSDILASFTSSGTPGYAFGQVDPPGDHTMAQYISGNTFIQHYLAVDLTPNVSFAGCWAWWTRQVAPAPGTATYSDVPTSHPQFRFVQALSAAGITGGCGGGNFCPNAPLTRGQMAVFLSTALGLGFPF